MPERIPTTNGQVAPPPRTVPSHPVRYPYPILPANEAQSRSMQSQQYVTQMNHDAQQRQTSGVSPTRVVMAPQVSQLAHVQQSPRISPPSQRTPLHVYHPPSNSQSPAYVQAPQTPQSATVSSEQSLRAQVVSLLSSTANGCILELGYPNLLKEHQRLQDEYAKLTERYNELQKENDDLKNTNLHRMQEFHSIQQQRDRESSQHVQKLNERIAKLENDAELLGKQCITLQQARCVDYPRAYKLLELKYKNVLELVRRHQIQLPNLRRQNATQANTTSNGNAVLGETVIDLTNSRGPSPNNAQTQQAATPTRGPPDTVPVPPQDAQTNVVLTPVSLNNSPPMVNQRPASAPQLPKHVRSSSIPSSTVRRSAPPTVQPFPRSVSPRPVINPDNSRQVSVPSAIDQTQVTTPTEHVAHDLRMQEHLAQFTAPAPSIQQYTHIPESPSVSSVHSGEGRPQLQVQTIFERPVQPAPPTPINAVATQSGKDNGSTIVSSSSPLRTPVHVVPETAATIESGKSWMQETGPQSQYQAQTRMQTQPLSPDSAPEAPAISNAQDVVERMEVDEEGKIEESVVVPMPQELKNGNQHGVGQGQGQDLSAGQDQDIVMSEENDIHERNVNLKGRGSENENEIVNDTSTIEVGIKQVFTSGTSNSDGSDDSGDRDPSGDNSIPTRASIHSISHPDMVELKDGREREEVQGRGEEVRQEQQENRKDNAMEDTNEENDEENEEEEEEEEEENWSDLTDDEDTNRKKKKQPVFDCISSIFYDDENDERFCTFCNARLENKNLPEPRPTFTDHSMRDMILHAKNEHPFVWEKLRRPHGGS